MSIQMGRMLAYMDKALHLTANITKRERKKFIQSVVTCHAEKDGLRDHLSSVSFPTKVTRKGSCVALDGFGSLKFLSPWVHLTSTGIIGVHHCIWFNVVPGIKPRPMDMVSKLSTTWPHTQPKKAILLFSHHQSLQHLQTTHVLLGKSKILFKNILLLEVDTCL